MLEPIEDLLQRELHAGENTAMCPRDPVGAEGAAGKREHGGAGGDEEGNVGDDEPESEDSARGGSHRREEPADSNTSRSNGVNVGVEPDDDAGGIDRHHRRGHLARIHQIVAAATDVDSASELAEKSPLGLPCDSVGETALHLKTLIAK